MKGVPQIVSPRNSLASPALMRLTRTDPRNDLCSASALRSRAAAKRASSFLARSEHLGKETEKSGADPGEVEGWKDVQPSVG